MARPAQQLDYTTPWSPVVLSLDGGGVRGLSSLYILRDLMRKIKDIDDKDTAEQIEPDATPLPCNYFDFMIGTSTGGLIAVMLGRLRMSVDDCIKQYLLLSVKIFRPPRTGFLYSRKVLQEATKKVVQNFCHCHDGQNENCQGVEDLRQHDYRESTDSSDQDLVNRTCKVAVVTVREGTRTTFSASERNVTILWRSYNHTRRELREGHRESELNPKMLESSNLKIHEACSATTAAPTYFRKVQIRNRYYVDGGVSENNPSIIAWNEARFMVRGPGPTQISPHIFVSLGTGKKKEISGFGLRSLVQLMLNRITDTEKAHNYMLNWTANGECDYYRFNVPQEPENPRQKGIASIKLDQVKKTKRNILGTVPVAPENAEFEALQTQAAATEEIRRDRYRPDKYEYLTFDKLRDRTMAYCGTTESRIRECATALRQNQVERRKNDIQRWTAFRKHPNPKYHVPSTTNNSVQTNAPQPTA